MTDDFNEATQLILFDLRSVESIHRGNVLKERRDKYLYDTS